MQSGYVFQHLVKVVARSVRCYASLRKPDILFVAGLSLWVPLD
ncbi:hypothetical protein CSC12_4340 [Klebsiella michiganensis]|nr:hypothetical protein CSC12_4340 [Klebsiella michiganensis]